MELNGEPKELETQENDAETVHERTRGVQQREKKSESENAWAVLKQAALRRF